MTTLSAREGYKLWAPHYPAETAVRLLEEDAVRALGVATVGARVADIGCGTASRLTEAGPAFGVGVDLTVEMLGRAAPGQLLVAGDVRALPLAADAFDVVWCRLVIGHLHDLEQAYRELGRLATRGGTVLVTDFHPAAVASGHRRTFRDGTGVRRVLEHVVHLPAAHLAAASAAELKLVGRRDAVVGPLVRHLYAAAGRLAAYDEQRGLPLVLALSFRKGV